MPTTRWLALTTVVLSTASAACGGDSSTASASSSSESSSSTGGMPDGGTPDAGPPLPKSVTFAPSFLWGAATAGFQVETGLDQTDWGAWAHTTGKVQNGDDPNAGPDAFAHVAGDVADLRAAGMNAYRFSIELARIYPTRAAFDADQPDADGLAKYDGLLAELASQRVTPLVTLHHFVWPLWMSDPSRPNDPQGWERSDAATVFGTWCSRMGKRYGDRVDWWVTINEPNVEASVGYLASIWPPGVADTDRLATVLKSQVVSHAKCFDALHAADVIDADGDGKAAWVSIAQHQRVYEPRDPTSTSDVAEVAHSDYFWNRWILNAIVRGDLDENFDGKLSGADKHADPTLVGRADYLGINYYGVSQVSGSGIVFPFVGALPNQFNLGDGRPKNDLGWSLAPEGFAFVLDEAASYGLPIIVTENGIADAKDQNRARFTLEHVLQIGAANDRGDDVRGYFHWALMDNFEWASGFCPKFGLYAVDLASPARTRTPTKAVPLLADLAKTGKLEQATIDALPAYVSSDAPCSSF